MAGGKSKKKTLSTDTLSTEVEDLGIGTMPRSSVYVDEENGFGNDEDDSGASNWGGMNGSRTNSRTFMEIMNHLQSNCRNLSAEYGIEIPIPQIAVMGGQTSGKSSTLENIAQAEILPKGHGTVTKGPVELRFHNSSEVKYQVGGLDIPNPKGVENAIREQSEYLAKRDGGISTEVIEVEIYSPNVPNMTLVDLPGLIEIHRDGQDEDLPERIRSMVRSYIEKEKTIILIVAAANEDLMNSKTINLAREVDKEGIRTFAVFTKLDNINTEGEEHIFRANLSLANEKLRLGATSVVNRIPPQSFQTARDKEAEQIRKLFPSNFQARQHGVEYLENTLSRIQLAQIKGSLDEIMEIIHTHLRNEDKLLKEVGFGEIKNKREILKSVVDNFAKHFIAQVDGSNRNIDSSVLSGGVFIKQVLYHDFKRELDKVDESINPSDEAMVTAIASSKGATGMNYLAELAFDTLVGDEILKMEQAAIKCLESVYRIMKMDIPEKCFTFVPRDNKGSAASLFPKLRIAIQEEVYKLLQDPKEKVSAKILDYIWTQAEIPSTSHPDFLKKWEGNEAMIFFSRKEMEFVLSKNPKFQTGSRADAQPSAAESTKSDAAVVVHPPINQAEITKKLKFVKELVKIYFGILKSQVEDHVPKMIKKHLVYYASDKIQATMTVFSGAVFEQNMERQLIVEGEEVIQKRKGALRKKRMLEDALTGFEEVQYTILAGGDGTQW